MRYCAPEILDVIPRRRMRIGAQWRYLHSVELRGKTPGIDANVIEDVLPTGQRGKEVVDPGFQQVPAKLEIMPAILRSQDLGQVQAVLPRLAGQDRGASESVDHAV